MPSLFLTLNQLVQLWMAQVLKSSWNVSWWIQINFILLSLAKHVFLVHTHMPQKVGGKWNFKISLFWCKQHPPPEIHVYNRAFKILMKNTYYEKKKPCMGFSFVVLRYIPEVIKIQLQIFCDYLLCLVIFKPIRGLGQALSQPKPNKVHSWTQ